MNQCHRARSQNRHAVEARRRGLELEVRAQAVEEEVVGTAGGGESGGEEDLVGRAGPAVVAGPPVQLNLGTAGHAFLAEWGLQWADEGDGEDDRSVSSGWERQRQAFGPVPIFGRIMRRRRRGMATHSSERVDGSAVKVTLYKLLEVQ